MHLLVIHILQVKLAFEAQEEAKLALSCDPNNDIAHHLQGRWHYEMVRAADSKRGRHHGVCLLEEVALKRSVRHHLTCLPKLVPGWNKLRDEDAGACDVRNRSASRLPQGCDDMLQTVSSPVMK